MLHTAGYFRIRGVLSALAFLLCGIGLTPGCYKESTPEDQIAGSDLIGEIPSSDLSGEILGPDVVEDLDSIEESGVCAATLEFAGEPDCPGVDIVMILDGTRDVPVRYAGCKASNADVGVTFELLDGEDVCQLDVDYSYTDAQGLAVSEVRSASAFGVCHIQACVDGQSDQCVVISVEVGCKCVPPMKVEFEAYEGMYPALKTAEVLLFKQTAGHPFACTDMDPRNLPVPTLRSASVHVIAGQVSFANLPDLNTDLTQDYTVVGLAYEQDSDIVRAWACDDTVADVEYGKMTTVILKLVDIAPSIIGSYEIDSTFDLMSWLPPTVDKVLDTLTGLATSPSNQMLLLMCDETILEEILGTTFCGYVFADPANPVIGDWGEIGAFVADMIEQNASELLIIKCPDPAGCTDAVYSSCETAPLLTTFRTESTMTCTRDAGGSLLEPVGSRLIAIGDCKEVWHTAVFTWRCGLDCEPGDSLCGVTDVPMTSLPGIGAPINADISGALVDGAYLQIDRHPVGLKYGALINYALEKIVLARVFGDGPDEYPPVDSLETLIGSLLAGRQCLAADTCCADFESALIAEYPDLPAGLAGDVCESLKISFASFVRDRINGLDSTADNFQVGTSADAPARIYDTDHNMEFDAIGTRQEQCNWDADLVIGTYTYNPTGSFYGVLK